MEPSHSCVVATIIMALTLLTGDAHLATVQVSLSVNSETSIVLVSPFGALDKPTEESSVRVADL